MGTLYTWVGGIALKRFYICLCQHLQMAQSQFFFFLLVLLGSGRFDKFEPHTNAGLQWKVLRKIFFPSEAQIKTDKFSFCLPELVGGIS